EVKYLVFDAPAVAGPFEERLAFVQDFLGRNRPSFAAAHPHERCRDLGHLKAELARVEGLGGEGLMMRQPGSRYEVGRSYTLLKVKNFQEAEARVLEHLPGAGRHKGRLGALFVELPDGTRFSVGTGFSDAERENPPPVGSLITFRYQELSEGGVPRFPSFVAVRDIPESDPAPVVTKTTKAAPEPIAPKETLARPNTAEGKARRFEFSEGKSDKVWEVSVTGKEMTVCFGRIGSAGQTKTKEFADETAAQREADRLITEKMDKGYEEVGG